MRLASAEVYPFHHAWTSAAEHSYSIESQVVFVAPVNTSQVSDSRLFWGKIAERESIDSLGQYLKDRVEKEFRRHHAQVVSERPTKGRIIELALVEAMPTDVPRNVLGTALGAFIPGGGIVSMRSSGSTAIEGVVRDAETNEVLFIFTDRERGKVSPFSFNDFTLYSHARDAINDWAEQLAASCLSPEGSHIADSSPVTLLPL